MSEEFDAFEYYERLKREYKKMLMKLDEMGVDISEFTEEDDVTNILTAYEKLHEKYREILDEII